MKRFLIMAATLAITACTLCMTVLLGSPASASAQDKQPAPYYDRASSRETPTPGSGHANQDEKTLATMGADDIIRSGDWSYEITAMKIGDDEKMVQGACITGYYGSSVNPTIPETIDGHDVRYIYIQNDKKATSTSKIESVTFAKNIWQIGLCCFMGMSQLKSVAFPSGSQLREIRSRAFENTGLTTFTMPESLETIDENIFASCDDLRTVNLNAKLGPCTKTFTVLAFYYKEDAEVSCYFNPFEALENLTINIPENSLNYCMEDGVLYSKDKRILYRYPIDNPSKAYTVPAHVKTIAGYAFVMSRLRQITLNEGLESIQEHAFDTSRYLESLDIPDSVVELQGYICRGCDSLKSVKIGNGVKVLGGEGGDYCFYNCIALKDVTLGSSIEKIQAHCFRETKIETIHIPDSVTSIQYGAFGNCKSLASVTGGANVEMIGEAAFANDEALTTFTFSDKIRSIGKKAFHLTQIPESLIPSHLIKAADGAYYVPDGSIVMEGTDNYTYAQEVLALVNQERAKKGLKALVMDEELLECAMQRAAELCLVRDHTRPTGDSALNISTKAMGENIASMQKTPAEAMESWMNSQGHRANILNSRWNSIGIGCYVSNGVPHWVQLFAEAEATPVQKTGAIAHNRPIEFLTKEHGGYDIRLRVRHKEIDSDGYDVEMEVGEKYQIIAWCPDPTYGLIQAIVDKTSLSFSTSDSSVATVDANGVITVRKEGSFTYTATLKTGPISATSTEMKIAAKGSSTKPGTTKPGSNDADANPASKKVSIKKAKVSIASKTYNGKSQSPTSIVVKLDGEKLTKGVDYVCSYEPGKKVGAYSVTITGSGSYKDSVTASFVINPKPITLSGKPKALKKGFSVKWKKAGAQVSGYQVRYSTSANFKTATKTKTVKSVKTTSLKVSKLLPKKKYYMQVRTYMKAGGKTYYSAWTAKKSVKTK